MSGLGLVSSQPQIPKIPDCKYLDIESVKEVLHGSDQAVVYGTRTCKYTQVQDAIADLALSKKIKIKKLYNWELSQYDSGPFCSTVEDRNMSLLSYKKTHIEPKSITRPCKTTLTDLVLENYKRIDEGKAVIPVLFCIAIDGDKRPVTMAEIAARNFKGMRVTGAELRRGYKLCTHENEKIRKAAEATFRFIRLKHLSGDRYALEEIEAPWANREKAAEIWKANRGTRETIRKGPEYNWKDQLEENIAVYEKQKLSRYPILPSSVPYFASKMQSLALQAASSAVDQAKKSILGIR